VVNHVRKISEKQKAVNSYFCKSEIYLRIIRNQLMENRGVGGEQESSLRYDMKDSLSH